MWIFFNKYILHNPKLVESLDAEPRIWRADCKVMHRLYRGSAPLTCVVQGSTVCVCLCVCVCIYIYIHTHTYTPRTCTCVCTCTCINNLWKNPQGTNSGCSRGDKLGLLGGQGCKEDLTVYDL